MSFLAPLYVLGVLGIGLPILFHLIRRQPKGRWQFSSLMFLQPTAPTVTRRSRLENWPLLLIRALALILLATAFARPFIRHPSIEPNNVPGKRIVMLIDTSASMRRSGLWTQVTQQAGELVRELGAADQIAIVSFDAKPRIELSLEQSLMLDAGARQAAASQAIGQLSPTWAASELGSALMLAADMLANSQADVSLDAGAAGTTDNTANQRGQIIVISDMQVGSEQNLKCLQTYSWPKQINAEIRPVVSDGRTNAVATVLQSRESDEPLAEGQSDSSLADTRVRIANSVSATKADFAIAWASANGPFIESSKIPIHIGPGESRIVKMPQPPRAINSATNLRLVLSGDDDGFDNVRYLSRPEPREQQLMYVGPEAAEAKQSLLYYLQRAPLDNRQRSVTIVPTPAASVPSEIVVQKTPLVIIAEALETPALGSLKNYLTAGGNVLWVIDQQAKLTATQQSLAALSNESELAISETELRDYSMWSKIEFGHPLFKPFADARYNDFTKIRFWSHRRVTQLHADANVIVSFDDGDPAIIEQTVAQGTLWILTTGWQPTNSQLALSTKFVPLVAGFYGYGEAVLSNIDDVVIGLEPPFAPSATATIEREDKSLIKYDTLAAFSAIDQPGFYRFVDGDVTQAFAANVADSESRIEPIAIDELERYGVQIGGMSDAAGLIAAQRQQQDVELESRQHVWQWLLCGVLGLLAAETWLSGYLDRKA